MSQTFSIACTECKEHLWIAQGWWHVNKPFSGCLYTSPKHKKSLLDFFIKHKGHSLIFDENCESEIGDYKEIEMD